MVKSFIQFCHQLSVSYKFINFSHVCWYLEFLAGRQCSAGTIANHLSHLRTFYRLAALPDAALHHYRVHLALRTLSTTVRRPSKQKEAVTPVILKAAMAFLPATPLGLRVKMALLLMFMGFLRQSSVTSVTATAFDPSRHITMSDVWTSPRGLHVRLKWSKTLQKSSDAKTLLLPPTQDPELCPVLTHQRLLSDVTLPSPASPYLAFQDGNPITTQTIARLWTTALSNTGYDPARLSLHSFRKGGASFTYNQCRADLNDVMQQGTWRSMAVIYCPPGRCIQLRPHSFTEHMNLTVWPGTKFYLIVLFIYSGRLPQFGAAPTCNCY